MAAAARIAASLGLALRDLRRDFPHAAPADLLDFAASVVDEAFEAPPEVREIKVYLSDPRCCCAPVLPRPDTVQ